MSLKNTNFFVICCLAMNLLTAKCEEKAFDNNSISDDRDYFVDTYRKDCDDESIKIRYFNYSQDSVSYSTTSTTDPICLSNFYLANKGANYAQILFFHGGLRNIYLLYSNKEGFRSFKEFRLSEFLLDHDLENISPFNKKVLWANAIAFLGNGFSDLKSLEAIKNSNYFIKKFILPSLQEVLEEVKKCPMIFEKGFLESVKTQMPSDEYKVLTFIRDNLNKSEFDLFKDPIKYKRTIFELSNMFTTKIAKKLEEERPIKSIDHNGVVKVENSFLLFEYFKLARIIFKNVISKNQRIIRALPEEVCQKIKELCKDKIENVDLLSEQELEEFLYWVCQQAAVALSKDIVMPWDKQ